MTAFTLPAAKASLSPPPAVARPPSHTVRLLRASRVRQPTCCRFYEDVTRAFPELTLYMVVSAESKFGGTDVSSGGALPSTASRPAVPRHHHRHSATSSLLVFAKHPALLGPSGPTTHRQPNRFPPFVPGVTAADEYRRTIGAMFAVYWLMRIGIDGEQGFSFGVDEHWTPRPPVAPTVTAEGAMAKRQAFYEKQEWAKLQGLLVESGTLRRCESGGVEVCVERTMALLALTAFHDVMKVEALLPRVEDAHHDFCGFKVRPHAPFVRLV